jgi:hypothetical protein
MVFLRFHYFYSSEYYKFELVDKGEMMLLVLNNVPTVAEGNDSPYFFGECDCDQVFDVTLPMKLW